MSNDDRLKFKEITTRPEKQQKPVNMHRKRKVHIQSADHPWRKWNMQVSDKPGNQRDKLIEVAA
jgi:hypothetical protein